MARSWEYPAWRRVVLQVTMWVVLAAALGLAQLVAHRRSQATRIERWQVQTVGALRISVPEGWATSWPQERKGRWIAFRAEEPEDQEDGNRVVIITQEPLPKASQPVDYLMSRFRVPPGRAMRFDFLNSHGAIAVVSGRTEVEEDGSVGMSPPMMYACAVVNTPTQGWLAVTIALRGGDRLGPADRKFLRQLADRLSLSNDAGDENETVRNENPQPFGCYAARIDGDVLHSALIS